MKKIFTSLLMVFSSFAMADSGLGSSGNVQILSTLIISIFTLLGLYLTVIGLYGIYLSGENPQNFPIRQGLMQFFAGCILLAAPAFYAMTVNSVSPNAWATDNTMLSVNSKIHDDVSKAKNSFLTKYLPEASISVLFGFIYLVGLLFFLLGLYLLKDSGDLEGKRDGGFSRAFWHMAGGAAVMNIVQVGCFLAYLLGISFLCMN